MAPSFLTRRAVVLSLAAALAAAHGTGAPGVAQEASPLPADLPRAGHPVIGAWQLVGPGPAEDVTLALFSPDGGFVHDAASPGLGLGIGVWRPASAHRAELVAAYELLTRHQDFGYDEQVFAPGAVPGPHSSLFIPGALVITVAIDVAVAPDAGPTTLHGEGPFISDRGEGFWSWWDALLETPDRVQVTGTRLVAPA